jgi:hypothetical protein
MTMSQKRSISDLDLECVEELQYPATGNVVHLGTFPTRFNEITYEDRRGKRWHLYLWNQSIYRRAVSA